MAWAFPCVAVPIVGAPGTVTGVTEFEADEAVPVPTAFLAVAVNVYAVPLVRPVTVNGELAPVAVIPPGIDVTVYPVIGDPPVEDGGVKLTVAWALPGVAVPIVGAPGTVAAGVTEFEAEEAVPVPTAFLAVAVNVYTVPLVSPVTVNGELAPVAVRPPGIDVTV